MKTLLLALTIFVSFLPYSVHSQCGNCTQNLSGTSLSPFGRIVQANEVYCINASGNLKRYLRIDGGVVCNHGTISADHIEIRNGGVLLNYGRIETKSIMLPSGEIVNQGLILSDDLYVHEGSITNNELINIDKMVFEITDANQKLTNHGVITSRILQSHHDEDFSVYLRFAIENLGELHVAEKLITSSRVDFTNHGSVYVGDQISTSSNDGYHFAGDFDFLNGEQMNFMHSTHATFVNKGQVHIAGNFGNYGDFYTECMIPVDGGMMNGGRITGPRKEGCGGFKVKGYTYFLGEVGADSSYVDICDLGSPIGGFDLEYIQNGGPNVSFCTCTNYCDPSEEVFNHFVTYDDYTISPNPIVDRSVLTIYNPINSYHQLTIYDVNGRRVSIQEGVFNNEITIDRSKLKGGVYFFSLRNEYGAKTAGRFVVR